MKTWDSIAIDLQSSKGIFFFKFNIHKSLYLDEIPMRVFNNLIGV